VVTFISIKLHGNTIYSPQLLNNARDKGMSLVDRLASPGVMADGYGLQNAGDAAFFHAAKSSLRPQHD
jgi:hypothetical protein